MSSSPISPLDGRYADAVGELRRFFSEEALMKARVTVEILYLIELGEEKGVKELPAICSGEEALLREIVDKFSAKDAATIKEIEKVTKHDVKAVEYFIRRKMERVRSLRPYLEFVHFGLTSEDVNNLAYGLLVRGALFAVALPSLKSLFQSIARLASSGAKTDMLALTHGQPATPTTLGKEMAVFADRLSRQMEMMKAFRMQGKLGGAVGNFSAHKIAYPDVKWEKFRDRFVKSLGLIPLSNTTQINPHDDLAELSHLLIRINTILLDFSRDIWAYVSRGIFRQKVVAGEIGSSTMPHKVNPIDFENAEGNLGISTALFSHFAQKLPVSRLQRDLSDSTVQRNIGVAFGYHLLAVKSLLKGIGKLSVDRNRVKEELAAHPEVAAEAIQTLLRKRGVAGAYEKIKALTRGEKITREKLLSVISGLPLPKDEKERLIKAVP